MSQPTLPSSTRARRSTVGGSAVVLVAVAGLVASAASGAVALTQAQRGAGVRTPRTAGARSKHKTPVPNKSFAIGSPHSSPVDSLVAANGTSYLSYTAYTSKSEEFASVYVCVLPRGATKCKTTTTLTPLDAKTSASDAPDIMLFGPDHTVDVFVTTSNDANGGDKANDGYDADNLEYVLSKSGAQVGAATRVGTLDEEGSVIRLGSQTLITQDQIEGSDGIAVEETPAAGTFPDLAQPTTINLAGTPAKNESYFYNIDSVALPNGDVLMTWDDLSNAYAVELDPADGFAVVASSEFKNYAVGDEDPPNASLEPAAGGAYLLLRSTTDGFGGKLKLTRFADKTGTFGALKKVPVTTSDYGDQTLYEDASGTLEVVYEVDGALTQDISGDGGKKWTVTHYAHTPEETVNVATALTSFGAGVVFEASGGTYDNGIKPRVQPIWVTQTVTLKLGAKKLHSGKHTTADGTVRNAYQGQKITLEDNTGSGWKKVAHTKTNAKGKYAFTVHPHGHGTVDYRVISEEIKGWYFAGQSSTHKLTVKG